MKRIKNRFTYNFFAIVLFSLYPPELVNAQTSDFCELNKIEISPDGQSAIFWKKPDISIGDRSASDPSGIFGYINPYDNKIIIKSAPLNSDKTLHLSALQWYKKSNKVAIIVNGNELYSLYLDRVTFGPINFETEKVSLTKLNLINANMNFQVYANENLSDQLQNLKLTSPSGSNYFSNTSLFYLGDVLAWLKIDNSFSVENTNDNFMKLTAIENNVQKSNQKLFKSSAINDGPKPQIVSYANLKQNQGVAFGKPIYNLSNGRVIGWFSPDKIFIKGLSNNFKVLSNNKINLDVSYNGKHIAILRGDGFGNLEAVLMDKVRHRIIPICNQKKLIFKNNIADIISKQDIPQSILYQNNEATYKVELLTNKKSNIKTGLIIHDVDDNNQDLIINFKGGPLGDPIYHFPSKSINLLYKLGKDTIDVAPPGYLGVSNANSIALSSNPKIAFNHSVEQIYDWIKNSNYKNITVVGNSFGAVYAYALAKKLDTKLSSVILVVPNTNFQINRDLGGGILENAHPRQITFENLVFGNTANRKRLQKLYGKVFSRACIKGKYQIFYAENDRLIDWKDRPKCLKTKENITVIPDVNHTNIYINNNSIDVIMNSISKQSQ